MFSLWHEVLNTETKDALKGLKDWPLVPVVSGRRRLLVSTDFVVHLFETTPMAFQVIFTVLFTVTVSLRYSLIFTVTVAATVTVTLTVSHTVIFNPSISIIRAILFILISTLFHFFKIAIIHITTLF